MAELVLGIDVGTSSTKGVLVDTAGVVVATATRSHTTSMPKPGFAEHDAEELWWAEFASISSELVAGRHESIDAVCCSGIGPCVLVTDDAGRPLRSAILYGIDARATREIDEWTAELGDEIERRCGSRLTTQAVGPKLAWIRRNEPDVWDRTRRFMMASSYIVHRLTGEYVLDHHSASQSTPLYDLNDRDWIRDWADVLAPGLELPRLVWPADVVGTVSGDAAAATGIPAGTPVAAGTIDAWAEALSVGVADPGDVMVSYGTTMFIIQVVEHGSPSSEFWLTSGVFPGTRTLAAGMATSGAVTSWFRELTGTPSFSTLEEEARLISPGAQGLIVLPYFAGERTPIFDPDARGAILGLTLGHTRAHLFRAVLEGIAHGARHNLELMAAVAEPASRIVAVGGGTRMALWTQIVSDVTGLPQQLPRETIGACYGDAILAATALGRGSAARTWNGPAATVEPDLSARLLHDELHAVYRELYPATRSQMHVLSAISRASVDPSQLDDTAELAGSAPAGRRYLT